MRRILLVLAISVAFGWLGHVAHAQNEHKNFDTTSVYEQLVYGQASDVPISLAPTWWDAHVSHQQRRDVAPVATDINALIFLALKHSNVIKIDSEEPLIRETAITEADSRFDWISYFDTAWNDTSEPVSTSLQAGGSADRLNDLTYQATGGVRRTNRYGGQVDLSQRMGWQDNNSTFFLPGQQASGQLTLSYTHPLRRGSGYVYNNSLVAIAQLEAGAAGDDFRAQLQENLLEVVRMYWLLYQERAYLAQQVSLFLKTKEIVGSLEARQVVDAQRTQLITASSALESRRADLIRARTAVVNAETRLRGMLNAPDLSSSDQAELVPTEFPSPVYYETDLRTEIQTALVNRPEAHAAIKQVKAGSTRLGIAKHEMMPLLNLVTQAYANGLRGDSEFGQAWIDQFSTGRPSYSLGLQYEMPLGNRLACARLRRRQVELRRLQTEYTQAINAIQTEVDIAVREMNTAYREIGAKSRALIAAEAEARTIRVRWARMVDGGGNSGLNLESLLRAQERVTQAENEFVTAMLTYNLAIVNLKRANGTLLQTNNVVISKSCDNCAGPQTILDVAENPTEEIVR